MTSASRTASSTMLVAVTPKRRMSVGMSVGGPQTHVGAELGQQVNVRPQDAAVKEVADDCDLETRQLLLALTNRERIEQCLRRVLVHSVTGVDDG